MTSAIFSYFSSWVAHGNLQSDRGESIGRDARDASGAREHAVPLEKVHEKRGSAALVAAGEPLDLGDETKHVGRFRLNKRMKFDATESLADGRDAEAGAAVDELRSLP